MSKSFSFDQIGFAPLSRPPTIDHYKKWLEDGFFAKMNYLKEHLPYKENPQAMNIKLRSAIVVGKTYVPHPYPRQYFKSLRLALYAAGEDYHLWLRKELTQWSEMMKKKFTDDVFIPMTDSSPVLERDLAQKAGLGWVGKNTCLIHPKKGSLFFIGEIYTSLDLPSHSSSLPDFCGKCTQCIDICPTQALVEPRKLDANRCISYWTIEAKEVPPHSLIPQFGDIFFGCDLCQTVCPWNQKPFQGLLNSELQLSLNEEERADLIEDIQFILSRSGKSLIRHFQGTPLLRAGPRGLKRNALIVASNHRLHELRPLIEKYQDDIHLGSLTQWILQTQFRQ